MFLAIMTAVPPRHKISKIGVESSNLKKMMVRQFFSKVFSQAADKIPKSSSLWQQSE
jgi:hypothetical protein